MTEEENGKDLEKKIEKEAFSKKEDDLAAYLSDMKTLESDFSDLEDLDFEELKEMQEAIAKVKEFEKLEDDDNLEEVAPDLQSSEQEVYLSQKEAMKSDFSDIEEIDFEELQEMQKAIESVKQEEIQETGSDINQMAKNDLISSDLEERIKEELLERKLEAKKEVITPEIFIERNKDKRDKIWYHALYYLIYEAEDNFASKILLYEMLKEVTSKSPIDPIPENQFYFGLGYILRLSLNEKQVVKYIKGGKFKVNVGIKGMRDLLEELGEPISRRPLLKDDEKKKMYEEFLNDDFFDEI
ncbi:MAG TPA: hypothetical protein VMV43_08785 [Candidatus Nanopelagicaceae bacterium]|nr:hypothetical protein [Candidatus Nanopelagicaceae bacterium]